MLTTCSPTLTRAERRRAMRPFSIFFGIYMCFFFVMLFAKPVRNTPLAWTVDLGNGLSMVAMLIAAGFGLARQLDEFQRKLFTQAMIWGIGGLLAITIIWGQLEVHTSIHRMDINLNFPLFVAITAIAKVTLFRRVPVSEE